MIWTIKSFVLNEYAKLSKTQKVFYEMMSIKNKNQSDLFFIYHIPVFFVNVPIMDF